MFVGPSAIRPPMLIYGDCEDKPPETFASENGSAGSDNSFGSTPAIALLPVSAAACDVFKLRGLPRDQVVWQSFALFRLKWK